MKATAGEASRRTEENRVCRNPNRSQGLFRSMSQAIKKVPNILATKSAAATCSGPFPRAATTMDMVNSASRITLLTTVPYAKLPSQRKPDKMRCVWRMKSVYKENTINTRDTSTLPMDDRFNQCEGN